VTNFGIQRQKSEENLRVAYGNEKYRSCVRFYRAHTHRVGAYIPTEQTQIKAIQVVYNEHTAEINTGCV